MCTHIQHPEGPLMSVTLERSQISSPNNAQLQRTLPGSMVENSYPIQNFRPDATLTQSQQPQHQLPSDTLPLTQQHRCPPSHTSVENHPVQSFLLGSRVYTQKQQPQGPLSNKV